MNDFMHYTQLYVNRRCKRAYQTYGECAKYYRYYRLSWNRFVANNDLAKQFSESFGIPMTIGEQPTAQITITPVE